MQLCEPAILLAQLADQSVSHICDWLAFTAIKFYRSIQTDGTCLLLVMSPLRTAMSDKDAKRIRKKLLASKEA